MFPINSVSDLENLSHAVKWQYFERLVAWIFEQNDFAAQQNVVVKTAAGKRQFDVIASKYDRVFLVECKKWKSRGQRIAALKSAVKKHLERCDLYKTMQENDPDDIQKSRQKKSGGISYITYSGRGRKIVPIIVTLLEEEITEHDSVQIVPIMKLNWFLNNFDV